jgi:hypothetical protein
MIKLPILCVVLGLLVSTVAHAAAPTIDFAGNPYVLASAQVSADGSVTNEYLPPGETLQNWTKLLAVRHWPKLSKVADAANPWMKMVQPLLTQKAQVLQPPGAKDGQDLVIEAWLYAPDRSYIEINLHRFVTESETSGVKAYQFAQKVPMKDGKGDPSEFIKRRTEFLTAVSKLKLPAHSQKP